MSKGILLDIELLNDYKLSLGLDIVKEMFDLYIEQSEVYLTDIKLAASAEDNTIWHEKCHKMKGAASSVGFVALRALLVTIERSQETQTVKQGYFNDLQQANRDAIQASRLWLSN